MTSPLTPEQEREVRDLSRGHNAYSAFEYRWLGLLAAALATIDALRDRLEWSQAGFDVLKDAIALAADSADRLAAEQEARNG